MDPATLQRRFGRPGTLTFDATNGMTCAQVHTPQATATLYLQGAHLTAWQPEGFEPAILLSHKNDFVPGKAIRGGIPIVFPWFAGDRKRDRIDGHPGPSHGFARLEEWTLTAAEPADDATLLRLELGPTNLSRTMGYDHFLLGLEFLIGHTLTMTMTVKNDGDQPLTFEQAFHTYYDVTDIHEVTLYGLEPNSFIDKTDDFKLNPASHEPLHFTEKLDRVYNNTTATCTIHDVAGRRRIVVEKTGSNTTVVWNPWSELPDLGPWDWHQMLAVETANVGDNSITLAPGASSTMQLRASLAKEKPAST
jgi:glucose-6-phosphate 1-epimerase